MTALPTDQIYQLYRDRGTLAGSPLSKVEFAAFWESLPEDERQYWAQQIQSGPTGITSEFFADLDGTSVHRLDEQVRRRLEEHCRRREVAV
jgi:hypothetical protein